MASSIRWKIDAHQGSQYYAQYKLSTKDSAGNKIIYDLTNKTLRGQVRTDYDSATAYDLTVDIVDAANGYITVYMGGDITSTMPTGPLVYDIEAADNLDPRNVDTIMWGNFYLRPEVTRT